MLFIENVSLSESPLAFTHSPGCMFISDLKDDDDDGDDQAPACARERPEVYCIGQNPLHYSIASATAVQKIRCLEDMIGADPGKSKTRNSSVLSQTFLLKMVPFYFNSFIKRRIKSLEMPSDPVCVFFSKLVLGIAEKSKNACFPLIPVYY